MNIGSCWVDNPGGARGHAAHTDLLVWRRKDSIWHSKLLVPNLYHTWLATLKRDVCVEKFSYSSVYFCRLNEVSQEMPILSFALKKTVKTMCHWYQQSRKLQLLLKKRVMFLLSSWWFCAGGRGCWEADGVPVCFNRAVFQGTPLSTFHFENHSLTIPFAVFITAHTTLPN